MNKELELKQKINELELKINEYKTELNLIQNELKKERQAEAEQKYKNKKMVYNQCSDGIQEYDEYLLIYYNEYEIKIKNTYHFRDEYSIYEIESSGLCAVFEQ